VSRGRDREPLDRGAAAELEEEIRHHVRERAELLMQEGWERDAALREAERRFGDVARIRRQTLAVHGREEARTTLVEALRSAVADVRYALRGVRANPGFALAVVATLALGIGAASSIFSVIDAILLRPMPYRDAERIVEVINGLDAARLRGWREASRELADGWLAYHRQTLVRTDGEGAEALAVVGVTPGADTLLGIPLLLGRAFTPEDARPGGTDVAILGRAYHERLGGDPGVVGSTLRLESGPVVVVGVLRGGVRFPEYAADPDLWIPLRDDLTLADRSPGGAQGVWMRLKPGVELAAAQERADALATSLQEEEPLERGWKVRLLPVGAHRANPDVKQALWTLAGTVAAIFLIACVNGVNLLLVRGSARSREMAVRMAIGGSRGRVVRQLLVEGLVLGLLGGVAAVLLAVGAVAGMRGLLPTEVLFFSPHAFGVEERTLAFAFAASVLVGTVLGLLPGLQLVRREGMDLPLSLAGRAAGDTPARRRLRNGLVVAQIALSMTLLAAAGLFVKSFARLVRVDPGYDYQRVALAAIGPSGTRYPEPEDRADLLRRLEEALEARPEVASATRTGGSGFTSGRLEAEGGVVPEGQPKLIPHTSVLPDYLEVMGIELVAGRGFEPSDAGTDAAIVDRDLARYLWGAESPLGRRFRLDEEGSWMTVVGVVRELRMMGRDQRDGPHQVLRPAAPERAGGYVEVAVRTEGDARLGVRAIREELLRLDPEQWIWKIGTAAEALAEEEDKPRFLVTLMSLLAGTALALAAVGLYGVLAYSVARRDRELGIRLALGAGEGRVRRMVLGEGLAVAGVGVALGLGGALAASRAIERLLYEVEPGDPATLAATTLLFLGVAAAACLFPARRATRVDPSEVLRQE